MELLAAADFALIIVVATTLGILSRRIGQPTIVAYIVTGVLLGPVVFSLVTHEGLVDILAELGLGFLLFLLGLKMRFSEIRSILRSVSNVAIGQTVLQTALAFLVAWALGFDPREVIVIALATVFGATPIIVKVLTDKDEITSLPGKIDVGVLIIQDIYLVIVLAMFAADSLEDTGDIATRLGVITVMMSFILIFSLASSRYLLPALFRRIANDKDVFLIVAIAWAFLFIAIAEEFELSVEVGAFLAGISLAQLPYSTELEDRITPITDFFILIFFASIGLQIESLESLLTFWQEAVIASVVLMVGNFWIMFYLIDREGFDAETSFLGSINMIQVSEFSLVVGALALAQGYIGSDVLGYLTLMAILTMTVSTYIIMYNHRLYARFQPWVDRVGTPSGMADEVEDYRGHAVAIGYDAVTERALPVLADSFETVVVIDRRIDHLERLADDPAFETIFGDVRHLEVRKAARIRDAAFVLSSTVERPVNEAMLEELDPDAAAFVEASSVEDARALYEHGATYVIMPTLLAGEALADHLAAFVSDRARFDKQIAADVDSMRATPEEAAARGLDAGMNVMPEDER